MKTTTYTIHRGTVRSSFALYRHTMAIYRRHTLANEALGKATHGLIEAEKHVAGVEELVVEYGGDGLYGQALKYAQREETARSVELRAAQSELKNATARASEAGKMHLVPFVPPYVPVKASRAFPALKTCTSPRRAARVRRRAMLASFKATANALRGIYRHDPTIPGAYVEMSVGYLAR